jgi:putative ABC transport system permease protein
MRWLRALWKRFAGLFTRSRHERDLSEEIETALQLHIDENVKSGMRHGDAVRAARLQFGSIDSVKEAIRDRRSVPIVNGIAGDIRFAARVHRKNSLFAAVAVLSLALGIGANTTVFSIAYGALKGLPFRNAERIVYLSEVDRSKPPREGPATVSSPDFVDIRRLTRSFEDLGTFGTGTYNISDDVSAPERVIGSRVTTNFFSLVEQKPLLGRDFVADEDRPGAEPVAIIGYSVWQNRFGGASEVLGRAIRVNGVVHKIIGVMPRGMRFPLLSDIWLPPAPLSTRTRDRGARDLDVFAVLRSGLTLKQAQEDLTGIAARLATEYPNTNKNIEIRVKPFAEQFDNQRNRSATWALIAAVCLVLLIVCANLANLLIARALYRTRETAIRMAIGATRWQIIRQLLVESLMLSFTGGLAGLALAVVAVRVLSNLADAIRLSARLPFWITFTVDYRVYIYLAAVCMMTGVFFGLAPALHLSRTDANERLKDGSSGAVNTIRTNHLTGLLVTSEIALTLTLLIAAGLMIRSIIKFQMLEGDPNTIVASVVLSGAKYAEPASRVAFVDTLLERLQSTPGISNATASSQIPSHFAWQGVRTEKEAIADVATAVVIPGYFKAVGATILRGRDFDRADGSFQRPVAIVNAQFAAHWWAGDEPVGKQIRKGSDPNAPWLTIIGVSSNTRVEDAEEPQAAVYTPYRQEPIPAVVLIAQSSLPRDVVVTAVRGETQRADPDLPLFNVMTMEEHMGQIGLPLQTFVWFFGLFGMLALLMSVVGIYGVTAYAANQRTREIGLRISLGATWLSIIWLVLRHSLAQLAIGLALGLAGAFAISRGLAGMLFHTAPTDFGTYVVAILVFVSTMLAACIVPASRAASIDPAASLRLQ